MTQTSLRHRFVCPKCGHDAEHECFKVRHEIFDDDEEDECVLDGVEYEPSVYFDVYARCDNCYEANLRKVHRDWWRMMAHDEIYERLKNTEHFNEWIEELRLEKEEWNEKILRNGMNFDGFVRVPIKDHKDIYDRLKVHHTEMTS